MILRSTNIGLQPGDLVFDALTFTLATGDPEFGQSAVETLEGIRLIKAELPGVLTSLGVSNVSFGLPPAARAGAQQRHALSLPCRPAWIWPSSTRPRSPPMPKSQQKSANWLKI